MSLKYEQLPIFRMYRNKQNGTCSLSLEELARSVGPLSLNPGYLGQVRRLRKGETLFQEIEIVKPIELIPQSIRSLLASKRGSVEYSQTELVKGIVDRLSNFIEKAWDTSKFHIMFHSSGYDSRIISGILSKLHQKHGDSWLGNILFLCFQPEGDLFKQIMQLEGWKPSQYVVFNEDSPATDYRVGLVDFTSCWKWTNDAQPPYALLGFDIESLIHNGTISEANNDMQLIPGSFGNETLEQKCTKRYKNFVDDFLQIYYYHRYSATFSAVSYLYGDFLMPFASADVLQIAIEASTIPVDIRELIIAELSPELLKLSRYSGPLGYDDPYHVLSSEVRHYIEREYHSSWYGQRVYPWLSPPPPTVFIQPWWSSYTAASLCEHLIHHGVQIRAPGKVHHAVKLWANNLDERWLRLGLRGIAYTLIKRLKI